MGAWYNIEPMTEREIEQFQRRSAVYSHASEIMENHGILPKSIRHPNVTPLVHRITADKDQLLYIGGLIDSRGFLIKAYEGNERNPITLFTILQTKCFDGDGKILNKKELKKVSEILGFIGKSLALDFGTYSKNSEK